MIVCYQMALRMIRDKLLQLISHKYVQMLGKTNVVQRSVWVQLIAAGVTHGSGDKISERNCGHVNTIAGQLILR
jgi:hypothetical protein